MRSSSGRRAGRPRCSGRRGSGFAVRGSGVRGSGLGVRDSGLGARGFGGASLYHRDVPQLWGFLAVALPLVVTPGASTAVVLRNSLNGGVRAGLVTTIGVNCGSLMYGLLCAFGFALALQRWPIVWTVIKVAGIAYLSWLGVQSLRHAFNASQVPNDIARSPTPSHRAAALPGLREGFLTNAMNPAIATFYFAVLPQFIPRGASIPPTVLLLTAVHIALAATCHVLWAFAGGALSRVLSSGSPRRVLDVTAGVALLLLAASLIR